ncbi:MAG: hypothetical protein R3F56_07630 [Planctomycetota bacterium]
MSDQVQHLIDRIKKDAVDTAEREGSEILAQARTRADEVLREAEARAERVQAEAERRARETLERGTNSLRQAARDLLLQVGARFEDMVQDVLTQAAGEAMHADVVEKILLRLADTFGKNGIDEGQVHITVGTGDRERLTGFVLERLRQKVTHGVTMVVDARMGKGFRLSYADGSIHHDFDQEAVAHALAPLVRPQLAQIVLQAALDRPVGASVP